MKRDMKRNILMRNMEFTERKQHSYDAGTAFFPVDACAAYSSCL